MQSRRQSRGPSEEGTSLRPSTPMSHAGSDFSRTLLMETAFRPQSPLHDILQCRSAGSGASPDPGQSAGWVEANTNQYDTTKFWKPFTIRLPYLLSLNILTLSFIIVIEFLYFYGNRHDGLLFMQDIDDLPLAQFFAIQYLPTLLSVLYGICWSIVDLDSKRLEPFYDMSKFQGASSEALFLEYQYQFALFVPFRAFFKRHWAVFLSSTIFLTATLIITPLQSSLLTTVNKASDFETKFNVTSQFLPVNGSDSALTPEFLFTQYTIDRLNGSLPGFTAGGDSFLPIVPMDPSFTNPSILASSNWSVTGTLYSLDVECIRPNFINITSASKINIEGDHYTLLDYNIYHQSPGYVCNITNSVKVGGNTTYRKFPGLDDGYDWDRPIYQQWCGFKNTTTFATYAWRDQDKNSFEIQSVLCEIKGVQEYEQDIVVNATTGAISERRSARRPKRYFSRESIDLTPFDAALFDKGSQANIGSEQAVFAKADIYIPDFLFNGVRPQSEFMDLQVFKSAIKEVYQHFFSLAVSTSPAYLSRSSNTTTTGKITIQGQVVTVDRTFATVLDVFLGAVLFLGIVLAAYSYQRDSGLKSDPDSLSATMALIVQSDLPSRFKDLDTTSTKALQSELQGVEVKVGFWKDASGGFVYKLDQLDSPNIQNQSRPTTNIEEEKTPLHLRFQVGVSFLLAHLGIIAVLAFLFIRSNSSGLPVLSNSSFVFNLIWAFIPTLVATLLEPMWASINRDISVLQPFYNLIKRHVSAGKSLSLKYQTIPIVLMARSLVARDFLLSLVSLMTALVSLLAVTLPGIFVVDTRAIGEIISLKPQAVSPVFAPDFWLWNPVERVQVIGQTPPLNPFAAVRANLSEGVALPAWSTPDYVFVPNHQSEDSQSSIDFYRAPTVGFHGSLDCRSIIEGVNGETVRFNSSNGLTSASFFVPNEWEGNPSETIPCTRIFGYKPPNVTETSPSIYNTTFSRWVQSDGWPIGEEFTGTSDQDNQRVTIAIKKRMKRQSEDFEGVDESRRRDNICDVFVPISWSRRSYKQVDSVYRMNGEPRETVLLCKPQFTGANFTVEWDRMGNIRNYQQTGASQDISNYLIAGLSSLNISLSFGTVFRTRTSGFKPYDASGVLMSRLAKPGVDYNDPIELGKLANQTFAFLFSMFVAQQMDFILGERESGKPTTVIQGTGFKYEKRVIMSRPLTFISLAILGLFCCTLVLVYVFRRRKYLPRQPTSLGSMLAYCQDSTVLDDLAHTWAMSTSQRQKHLESLGHTYGFGWYRGRDGTKRLGVDKEPLLTDYAP